LFLLATSEGNIAHEYPAHASAIRHGENREMVRLSQILASTLTTKHLTIINQEGVPLSGVRVTGALFDDYWLDETVAGQTNSNGQVTFQHVGPPCVERCVPRHQCEARPARTFDYENNIVFSNRGSSTGRLILRDDHVPAYFCQCWPDVRIVLRGRRFHRLERTAVFHIGLQNATAT